METLERYNNSLLTIFQSNQIKGSSFFVAPLIPPGGEAVTAVTPADTGNAIANLASRLTKWSSRGSADPGRGGNIGRLQTVGCSKEEAER
jgi:hypothetical protein